MKKAIKTAKSDLFISFEKHLERMNLIEDETL